jgi:hypothetical protein
MFNPDDFWPGLIVFAIILILIGWGAGHLIEFLFSHVHLTIR